MQSPFSSRDRDSGDAKAYDMLIRNCQDFAGRLKKRLCTPTPKPKIRKRRVIKKTGKFLKVIFGGPGKVSRNSGLEFSS